ncbi:MAG: virulence RhuM family protein [Deltaproteobacteria bacterium]|nr:virulence RhuM family protein [Deltaproteobacteria bacterium]
MTDHLPGKRPPSSEILFYKTEDGRNRIEVRLDGDTVWLSQRLLAELFQKDVRTINEHIQNICEEGELSPETTIRKFRIVQTEGKREVERGVDFFNLDVIIAVGYRVKSHRGTQFRRWATERLREYLVKGFTMDDERLKEGRNIGEDYFDELLERIRDIRASEKRFYQKIRDIYKLAIDYDAEAEETKEFFQVVQNKLHWAITGKTAAELISERANSSKPNMGLTSWKGPKVRRTDVAIAKNYLSIDEIGELNRIVVMYLDYAEDQAHRRKPLYMHDWRDKIDAFLKFNERAILEDAGKVSMEVAKTLALEEYDKFNQRRLVEEAAKEEEEFEKIARQLERKGRRKKK